MKKKYFTQLIVLQLIIVVFLSISNQLGAMDNEKNKRKHDSLKIEQEQQLEERNRIMRGRFNQQKNQKPEDSRRKVKAKSKDKKRKLDSDKKIHQQDNYIQPLHQQGLDEDEEYARRLQQEEFNKEDQSLNNEDEDFARRLQEEEYKEDRNLNRIEEIQENRIQPEEIQPQNESFFGKIKKRFNKIFYESEEDTSLKEAQKEFREDLMKMSVMDRLNECKKLGICGLCFMGLEIINNDVVTAPCYGQHRFHKDCFWQWNSKNKAQYQCPCMNPNEK